MKKHRFFIITFTLAIIIFFWKVILLRAGFLGGDYIDQCYPWSLIYAKAIKAFTFPFWTRYVQSGYPLMGEGQVGGFYPLNIIIFFIFPFKFAYNYVVILHFFLAGFFTYMFSRKIGLCEWGATLASLMFCFGSAYAGCYINTATVKALCWFPLVLFFLENYQEKEKLKYVFLSGIALGVGSLAGSTQVALYSFMFSLFYFAARLFLGKKLGIKSLSAFFLLIITVIVIFLPQYDISKVVADLSWRGDNASLDFALWGSFSPLNLLSTVFPYPVITGAKVYIGVLSLFFLILGVSSAKYKKQVLPIALILFLSFFLALGKYNPLYVWMIDMTRLYFLRNPSKFLLFTLFSASILSGYGFSRYFYGIQNHQSFKKYLKISVYYVSIMVVLFLAGRIVLIFFKSELIEFGKNFVEKFIYGKDFHRFDLNTYNLKVEGLYNAFVSFSSPVQIYNGISLFFCGIAVIMWIKVLSGRSMVRSLFLKGLVFTIIFMDLFVFSMYGTGFRGNIKNYDVLEPEKIHIFDLVQKDKSLFRILPFGIASGMLPNWTIPSANAIHKVDSVALYTPLANEYYKEALFDLEVVDCALGLKLPNEEAIPDSIDLIRLLNVKYLISYRELKDPNFIYVLEEDGIFLYMVKDFLPRFFVSKDILLSDIVPDASIDIVRYASGYAEVKVNFPYEGYLMFSENRFPGWEVFVDGNKKDLLSVSVIQGVKINGGEHTVKFIYKAFGHKIKK